MSSHLLADASSGASTGRIAVHHDDEVRRGEQELALHGGEVCAEERDRGDADLIEAHDAPRALDDDEVMGAAFSDPVEVVEHLVFGQPWREVPLASVSDGLWIESSSGIAEGPRLEVMETDADGLAEEARSPIEPGLEAARGMGKDRLVSEEIGLRVEWQRAAVRDERPPRTSDSLDGRVRWIGIASQRAEVVSDLPIGASIESSDELDDIAAGVTSGEASPEVLVARDRERSRVVASVDGAGTAEGMSLSAQASEQASLGEDLLDGNESLQAVEAQMSRDHGLALGDGVSGFPFPRLLSGCAGKGNGKLTTRRADSRARS